MTLYQLILKQNECYKSGRTMTPKGIMVHSTGANNPRLSRYVGPDDGRLGKNQYNNHWNAYHPGGSNASPHTYVNNGAGRCKTCGGQRICCHAFIGKLADGSVATYQLLPWTMRGWHGASGPKGSVNDTHIGFEVCEDGLTDPVYFRKAFDEAVGLCAFLCKKYHLDPMKDGVIIGHYEGYQRGIASNHGDPRNWFPKHGESMSSFRAAVKKAMGGKAPAPVPTPTPQKPATETKATITAAQQAFIDLVGEQAQADGDILPSLTIAQAILESGWGKSDLAQKANALFGIKAGTGWKGPRVDSKSKEHIDAKRVDITAAFRAYDSWEKSIEDHGKLLRAERYKAVIGERDYKTACRAVHTAGYATDPEYANKLIKLIEQYGLAKWDATPPDAGERIHAYKDGETLWSLAVEYLGDGNRWTEIQSLNGGPEKCDPHRLRSGTILKIPNERRQ